MAVRAEAAWTCGELAEAVRRACFPAAGAAVEGLRVLHRGRDLAAAAAAGEPLAGVKGLRAGGKLMVVGTVREEAEAVRAIGTDPALRGFAEELAMVAAQKEPADEGSIWGKGAR